MGDAPRADVPTRFPLRETAWFFDIDGTLAEMKPTPEMVQVAPGIAERLTMLFGVSQGAVAVVSGRSLASIDALLAPLVLPASGQHGAQRRDADGAVRDAGATTASLAAARQRIAAWVGENPLVRVEDKGHAIAIHYRAAPEFADAVHGFAQDLAAADRSLRAQPGKMVVEILDAAHDKGAAIRAFLAEPPFRGRRPVFLGDDLGDEPGFEAVNRAGGVSIKIGNGPTAAQYRLPDVQAVQAWLAALVA